MRSKKILFLGLVLSSQLVFAASNPAQQQALDSFMVKFQEGAYAQALQVYEKLPPALKADTALLYWNGVAQSKLQNYDGAIEMLSKVVAQDTKAGLPKFKDASFLLGQSQYANQNFAAARGSFEQSVKLGYKPDASTYYLGTIESVSNQPAKAIQHFQKVATFRDASLEMKQAAQYQMAEICFTQGMKMPGKSQIEKVRQKKYFKETVIPTYEKARNVDDSSNLVLQIDGRINQAKKYIGESSDVPRTASGTAMPIHSGLVKVTQDIKYDTNIISQSDNKVVKVSNAASWLSKTAVFAKYEKVFRNWFAVTPEFGSDMTWHFRRGNVSVIQNDTVTFTPAMRFRLDHKAFGYSAAGIMEYEFNYTLKDWQGIGKQNFYSYYNNIILGERLDVLPWGATIIKPSLKYSINHDIAKNYYAPKLLLTQYVKMYSFLYSLSGAFELQKAKDIANDQRKYDWNNSFSMPRIWQGISVDVSANISWTDTMNQQPARGTEKTFSPGLTLSYVFCDEDRCSVNTNYAFTRNISLDKQNYDYAKHVYGAQFSYNF